MKFRKSSVALAVSTALGLGLAGEASAAVYAGAGLNITNLSIVILNDNGSLATINSFDFRTTTASDLNGVQGVGDTDSCSTGVPCGGAGAPLVLDSQPSSIGIVRPNNTFTFLGPGGGEFGSSDNVIRDAQLVGDAFTSTQGIAEAELTTGTSAGATSTIRSTTGFTFSFTLGGTGTFSLSGLADPDQYAELIDPTASGGTASSSLTTTFRLTGPNGVSVSWAPDGDASNNCLATGVGVSCSQDNDTQNLNLNVTAPFGSSDDESFDPLASLLTAFGITVTGLPAGVYSFTLQATQEANVTRFAVQVPEPGSLLLISSALLGLGYVSRRRYPGAS